MANLAGFPGEEAHRKGFYTQPQQEGNYTRWDYNSNDGDVCCAGGSRGAWLVWGASSQGRKCQAAHCSTNAVGYANMTLNELLEGVYRRPPATTGGLDRAGGAEAGAV